MAAADASCNYEPCACCGLVRLGTSERASCPSCDVLWRRDCQAGVLSEASSAGGDDASEPNAASASPDVLLQAVRAAATDDDAVLERLAHVGSRVASDGFAR
eukprot:14613259-Alexandrium_andersonii.AAC.1